MKRCSTCKKKMIEPGRPPTPCSGRYDPEWVYCRDCYFWVDLDAKAETAKRALPIIIFAVGQMAALGTAAVFMVQAGVDLWNDRYLQGLLDFGVYLILMTISSIGVSRWRKGSF